MEKTIFENTKWKKTAHNSYIQLFASQPSLQFQTKPILIVGGVHGDEPEGVWLCEKLLQHLKVLSQKRHTNGDTAQPWIMVPCLNPDGLQKNERVNGNGVDLNRNFPSQDWSPDHTQPRYYPGKNPGSEVETQAIIELLNTYKPSLIIHCHSWKPSIIYTGDQAKPVAQILADVSSYELQPDIGYPTPGSLGQYGFLEHQIGVICIEEREGATADETWKRFQKAFDLILNESP